MFIINEKTYRSGSQVELCDMKPLHPTTSPGLLTTQNQTAVHTVVHAQ